MRSLLHSTRDKSTVIYFLRHGQTPSDRENRFTGWVDEDPTPKGIQDVKDAVREVLSKVKFGKVFCSDLTRAVHTAEMAVSYSKTTKEPLSTPGARTWGIGGKLSGKPKTKENLAEKEYYIKNPDELPKGENAETINESRRRVLAFLAYVISMTPLDMPSLVVCHSNMPKIVSDAYGDGKMKLFPSGIMKMEITEDGVALSILRLGPEVKDADTKGSSDDPLVSQKESVSHSPSKGFSNLGKAA